MTDIVLIRLTCLRMFINAVVECYKKHMLLNQGASQYYSVKGVDAKALFDTKF